jgi:hypothetical protein
VGRIHKNEKEKKAGSALLTLHIPQQKANNIERNTFPKFFSQCSFCASIVKSKPMAAKINVEKRL